MARDNEPGMGKAKGTSAGGNGKRSKYVARGSETSVRIASISAESLRDAVDAVTNAGDAILLARTTAGDCLVFTVCSGAERIKFYARTVEEAETVLADIENQAADS